MPCPVPASPRYHIGMYSLWTWTVALGPWLSISQPVASVTFVSIAYMWDGSWRLPGESFVGRTLCSGKARASVDWQAPCFSDSWGSQLNKHRSQARYPVLPSTSATSWQPRMALAVAAGTRAEQTGPGASISVWAFDFRCLGTCAHDPYMSSCLPFCTLFMTSFILFVSCARTFSAPITLCSRLLALRWSIICSVLVLSFIPFLFITSPRRFYIIRQNGRLSHPVLGRRRRCSAA